MEQSKLIELHRVSTKKRERDLLKTQIAQILHIIFASQRNENLFPIRGEKYYVEIVARAKGILKPARYEDKKLLEKYCETSSKWDLQCNLFLSNDATSTGDRIGWRNRLSSHREEQYIKVRAVECVAAIFIGNFPLHQCSTPSFIFSTLKNTHRLIDIRSTFSFALKPIAAAIARSGYDFWSRDRERERNERGGRWCSSS